MNYKELIKQSIDTKYYRNNIWIILLIDLFWLLTFTFTSIYLNEYRVFFISLIFIIPTLIVWIYLEYQIYSLFHIYDKCEIYEVVLNEFHSVFFIRNLFYTITIPTPNGVIKRNTRTMFNTSLLSSFNLENYNNKKVLIGYNPNSPLVIVFNVIN